MAMMESALEVCEFEATIGKRKTVGQENSAVAGVPTLHSTLGSGWPASLPCQLSFPSKQLAQSKITSALCHTPGMYSGSSTRAANHIPRLDLPYYAAKECRAAGCRVETLASTGDPESDRRPTL